MTTAGNRTTPDQKEETFYEWKGFEKTGAIFKALAEIPWSDDFLKRDTIDLARMTLDRTIVHGLSLLRRDFNEWKKGQRAGDDLPGRAARLAALVEKMADVLELHTDYSLWESFLRLDAIEKVRNPDFPRTLLDNASNGYCRSHQYELARYWYEPRAKAMATQVAKAVATNSRKAVLFPSASGQVFKASADDLDCLELAGSPEKERQALLACPLQSMRPTLPRTEARYRATMHALADIFEGTCKE